MSKKEATSIGLVSVANGFSHFYMLLRIEFPGIQTIACVNLWGRRKTTAVT